MADATDTGGADRPSRIRITAIIQNRYAFATEVVTGKPERSETFRRFGKIAREAKPENYLGIGPRGGDLFVVDNGDSCWTGLRYLEEW